MSQLYRFLCTELRDILPSSHIQHPKPVVSCLTRRPQKYLNALTGQSLMSSASSLLMVGGLGLQSDSHLTAFAKKSSYQLDSTLESRIGVKLFVITAISQKRWPVNSNIKISVFSSTLCALAQSKVQTIGPFHVNSTR